MTASPWPRISKGSNILPAEWVSRGWRLVIYRAGCRKLRADLSDEDIMIRFCSSLLSTVRNLCDLVTCEACGGAGAWHTARNGPNVASGENWSEGSINIWQARDLHLWRLLHEHGRPMAIGDVV